jgi:pyruvate, water dikinase
VDKLYWLNQIQTKDHKLVGDKAFYLSQLLHNGFTVNTGIVVPAIALGEFLQSINWREPLGFDLPYSSLHLDVDNHRELQRFSQKIRQEIMVNHLPLEWVSLLKSALEYWEYTALILRPSLYISFKDKNNHPQGKGLLPSRICPQDITALTIALKRSWSDLFSARSLFYWQKLGIEIEQINLAILIQPISPCITSGMLSLNQNICEINATWGLPNSLTQGTIVPDSYTINLNSKDIESKRLGTKTVASKLVNPYFVMNKTEFLPNLPSKNTMTEIKTDYTLSPILEAHCFQSYILSEDQQKQFALEDIYLNQLIDIAQRIRRQVGENIELEWMLSLGAETSEPELYISQIEIKQNQKESININNKIDHIHNNQQTKESLNLIVIGLAASTGKIVGQAQIIFDSPVEKQQIPEKTILIGRNITPDYLPLLNNCLGVISEQGGATCHAAIIARELGIPAIVGAKNATKLIKSGETILMDGDLGKIYQVNEREKIAEIILDLKPTAIHDKTEEIIHKFPPIGTKILVNLSQKSSIQKAINLPIDGVGLLRSELMMQEILQRKSPHLWLDSHREQEIINIWAEHIEKFASAFHPQPVFYRFVDWRSQEFASLSSENYQDNTNIEPNPMLGLRGTFKITIDPVLFDIELSALSQINDHNYKNINVILPFVRTVEEFIFCKEKILEKMGKKAQDMQIWIMAEVPSVLFLLPEYVKAGVQGISIGTNDLTQLILGVDRDQSELSSVFDEKHPAVRMAIKQLITMAKNLGIPCSICGQAPVQYPELIEELIYHGITGISVEVDAVYDTYKAIARAEQKLLLAGARKQLN